MISFRISFFLFVERKDAISYAILSISLKYFYGRIGLSFSSSIMQDIENDSIISHTLAADSLSFIYCIAFLWDCLRLVSGKKWCTSVWQI